MQTILVILIVAACVAALGWRLWKYFRRGTVDCGCSAGNDCPGNGAKKPDGDGGTISPIPFCSNCPIGDTCHSSRKKES
ncbi:MAG: FeoB-associated Cys-rich membrane protein [Rikenellaceae bacterium]|jgi:hypothetical protein|nr:FeoB-associated Cys-rich membrane protein [Rikenellaceae bacterium]